MRAVLSLFLLAVLLATAGAHAALLVGLFKSPLRYRAIVAFFLPPLAPYYGWMQGMRRRTLVWVVAVVAYAVGVGIANA
jgi:hypothetical protein